MHIFNKIKRKVATDKNISSRMISFAKRRKNATSLIAKSLL